MDRTSRVNVLLQTFILNWGENRKQEVQVCCGGAGRRRWKNVEFLVDLPEKMVKLRRRKGKVTPACETTTVSVLSSLQFCTHVNT